jgi:pyridinium-3,5-biscarboxylic acid mononucleotide synthase
MKNLLDAYRRGELNAEEVQERLMRMLYDEGEDFLLDLHRSKRIGFPEVIFAEGKSTEQLLSIARILFEKNGQVFVSTIDDTREALLRKAFPGSEVKKAGRLMVIRMQGPDHEALGRAGIITAGTADAPFAQETALILEESGVEIIRAFDYGASGMHRPLLGLKKARAADILIIFAGMDGVLPTLMASLTDQPIIAVPTPVGYGFGGDGAAALSTMLQCCVPGVTVVNIGNTVGAAGAAIRILKAIKRGSVDHSR